MMMTMMMKVNKSINLIQLFWNIWLRLRRDPADKQIHLPRRTGQPWSKHTHTKPTLSRTPRAAGPPSVPGRPAHGLSGLRGQEPSPGGPCCPSVSESPAGWVQASGPQPRPPAACNGPYLSLGPVGPPPPRSGPKQRNGPPPGWTRRAECQGRRSPQRWSRWRRVGSSGRCRRASRWGWWWRASGGPT